MPLMDEFREEREALKHGTPKEKMQYFWDYYKWHTIAVIIGVCCIISLVHTFLSAKDAALNIVMLNCTPLDINTNEMHEAYAEYAGIDLREYELRFDTDCFLSVTSYDQATVNTMQKLMVNVAAGDLDAMMGGGEAFAHYANASFLCDLRDILSVEQLAAYEPYFYYVDRAVVEELEKRSSELQDNSTVPIPAPANPEEMEDPIPVAIFIDPDKLIDHYYFQDVEDDLAIGVFANAPQLENTLAFIDYIMQL